MFLSGKSLDRLEKTHGDGFAEFVTLRAYGVHGSVGIDVAGSMFDLVGEWKKADKKLPKRPPPDADLVAIENLIHPHKNDPLLGDMVEAWAKTVGADRAAKAWEKWTGIPCGCEWRKGVMNKLHERVRKWGKSAD